MSYENLLEIVSSPDLLAYKGLALFGCLLLVCALLFGRRSRSEREEEPSVWLQMALCLVIISTATLPALYRLIPVDTAILPWECESVSQYYQGLSLNESIESYARKSVLGNSGVLSASGHSLLYGVPTYYLLDRIGWSVFSVRAVAYLLGLLALIPGYFFVRRLVNPNVALLFVMLLATNTHTVFYMGYGVSSTATIFGLLFALALCVAAIQARWAHRYILAVLAGAALFVACFNYSPAKVFVSITLALLAGYGVANLLQWRAAGRSALAALLIVATTVGLLSLERRINPGADFASARGEQAFILMRHKEQILNYLGNTPDVQAIEPESMPLAMKARFLLSVAQHRIPEFLGLFNPMVGMRGVYPRGSFDAPAMPAYPVGLFPFFVLGFVALLVSPLKMRSVWTLGLLIGGVSALLLTTRFDSHRSFILVIPVLITIAHGIWTLLGRLRGGFIRESLSALLTFGLAAALIANSWFFMAKRESQPLNTREYARNAEGYLRRGTSIAMHLTCETRALVALHLGDIASSNASRNFTLWDPELGSHLIDQNFKPNSVVYERFLREAMDGESVLLYDAPLSLLLSDLQTKPVEVRNSSDGTLGVLVVSSKRETPS